MQRDAEQRREQIVRAAYAIVEKGGAQALTAQAVTKEVGVSRPLLYHYFDTMDALLDVVVDHYVDQFCAVFDAWASSDERVAEDPRDGLLSAVRASRAPLVDACPLTGGRVDQVSSAYLGFLSRCASKIAEAAGDGAGRLARYVREAPTGAGQAASMLVFGLCGTLLTDGSVTDEQAAELAATTLGIPQAVAAPMPAAAPSEPAAQPVASAPAAQSGGKGGGLFSRIFGR